MTSRLVDPEGFDWAPTTFPEAPLDIAGYLPVTMAIEERDIYQLEADAKTVDAQGRSEEALRLRRAAEQLRTAKQHGLRASGKRHHLKIENCFTPWPLLKYENIMALLKPEPLATGVMERQMVPFQEGRTPRACQKWPELKGLVHDWSDQCDLKNSLSCHRRPAPFARVYGTSRHPRAVRHEQQIYSGIDAGSCITLGIHASVNDALEVLDIPARYVDSSGSGRTEADLRVVIYGGEEERTWVPQEVKLDDQVHIPDGLHYVDAVRQGGKSFEAVRQNIAQTFMYMVEERAMYGILNTKTKYVFFQRDSDVASGRVRISETFDGETEPVGPILVWIAAMAAGGSGKKQRVLPHIEHELLEIGQTRHRGHNFLLREGKCCGQDALFKVFDFFKRPEALATLEEEAGIYERMATIQGAYVPSILQVGLSYGGGMGFMAMSAGGPSLAGGCSTLEHDQAKKALQQVHACGVLHGDVNASNFIRAADGSSHQNGILVVDFVESIYLSSLRWEAKAEEIMQLEQALTCPKPDAL
ncbi:hypothetical protein WJX74_008021 [Apatococcus lobatus]|uniref:Protein kinase domain-containing protein n=1 Tax=Apatococcus lobatus TaxID=904363 RepID=A0AAW1QWY2_9CHLO